MIYKAIVEKRTTVAQFGNGTTKVRPFTNMGSGFVELTTCKKTDIGKEPSNDVPSKDSRKITMIFDNVKSLDVLILKLQELREDMLESKNG